jgi:hypothetical protein
MTSGCDVQEHFVQLAGGKALLPDVGAEDHHIALAGSRPRRDQPVGQLADDEPDRGVGRRGRAPVRQHEHRPAVGAAVRLPAPRWVEPDPDVVAAPAGEDRADRRDEVETHPRRPGIGRHPILLIVHDCFHFTITVGR